MIMRTILFISMYIYLFNFHQYLLWFQILFCIYFSIYLLLPLTFIIIHKFAYYYILLRINQIRNNIYVGSHFLSTPQDSVSDTEAELIQEKLARKHRELLFQRGEIIDKINKLRTSFRSDI